uniref:Uncharacterized protein n=1 Tax=Haptolina brevifila TaxID=156173 RepID=A0A7S2NS11_9EUKA|mmetsp:Transcript_9772/g.19936  ORF Transcript_9772/g.19936 Transcript_9772/m.19936 type:complete len:108 (+) Transcript_9772:26-349(+)
MTRHPCARRDVCRLLGHQLHLHEPKVKAAKKAKRPKSSSSGGEGGNSAHQNAGAGLRDGAGLREGGGSATAAREQAEEEDEGEVEVMGERSWEERDTELRKHAIELD